MLNSWFRRSCPSATPAARRRSALRSRPTIEAMEGRQLLSTMTFDVTTNEDSGSNAAPLANSLRWAIIQADKVGAGNTAEIDFHLPTNVPRTIAPDDIPLPAVTVPTFFNGASQAGYAGSPLVQLDGSEAGAGAIGLQFLGDGASGSQVVGLQIINFNGGGVQASGANRVQLDHDWVGVATLNSGEGTQVVPRGNGTFGVEFIHGASQGSVTNSVVSGNQYNGVVISDHSNSTLVSGSFIGTDPTGAFGTTVSGGSSFGNGVTGGGGSGVVINGGSSYSSINNDVISNSHNYGVFITDQSTSGNQVINSKIGTDVSGNVRLPNFDGVTIANGASSNTVGFNGAGNVIAGNTWDGVQVVGLGTVSNIVQGNKIGTNAVGGYQIPNGSSGVAIAQGASFNTVDNDLISGNTHNGVYLSDANTVYNTVSASIIGADVHGTYSVPNNWGVLVQAGAQHNTISGDLISGNSWTGVELSGQGTSGNVVSSDKIGTDTTGNAPLANPGAGVAISNGASGNTVTGDLISGNNLAGVWVSASSGNQISSSTIGLSASGTLTVPNGIGIELLKGSSGNTVSGDLISGNAWDGLQLLSGASGNQVQGNKIGTDPTGTFALGNRGSGVAIASGANGNTVGGPSASYRNLISGNGQDGVYVSDSGTNGNTIQYDYIGTDLSGEHAVSNGLHGVAIQGGAAWDYVYNDLISANLADGVLVTGSNTHDNFLSGDWIGLDGTGTRALKANGRAFSNSVGVEINNGAYNTSVGNNFISGNNTGVAIENGATSNWVVYDHIGTDVNGNGNVGNVQDGVILNAVSNNLIGYDTIAYNGDVGILGEIGATAGNNSLISDNLFGNKNGPTDFD